MLTDTDLVRWRYNYWYSIIPVCASSICPSVTFFLLAETQISANPLDKEIARKSWLFISTNEEKHHLGSIIGDYPCLLPPWLDTAYCLTFRIQFKLYQLVMIGCMSGHVILIYTILPGCTVHLNHLVLLTITMHPFAGKTSCVSRAPCAKDPNFLHEHDFLL